MDCISLRGGRQNNLQGIDLDIPLGKLTVICGVSGSGKSSLALDTLYAEGQRRYIESFSAYSRQFLERIEKPKYESLTNLPPSIALTRDQRSRNNRSTVGTASELLEHLRVVFSHQAQLTCYGCGQRILSHTPKTVSESLATLPASRGMIGFEIQWESKEALSEILFDLQTSGFVRLVSKARTLHLADEDRTKLAKQFEKSGRAFVIVDRITLGPDQASERLLPSVALSFEQADHFATSALVVLADCAVEDSEKQEVDGVSFSILRYREDLHCSSCNIAYPEPEPRLFNFNNAIGACSRCEGFGETISIDLDKVVPDKRLSLREGAIAAWRTPAYGHVLDELIALADDYELPLDLPVSKLKAKHWKIVLEGIPERSFGGLNGFFQWLERKKYKMHVRAFLARWRTYKTCDSCFGKRLNKESLAYRVHGNHFADLCELTVDDLRDVFDRILDGSQPIDKTASTSITRETNVSTLELSSAKPAVNVLLAAESKSRYMASEPARQVSARLRYLQTVGVGYLSLARPIHTLSSGEAQRVVMTTLLGSSLVDMLYVFDEPTVGLHPQDIERIATSILELRNRGNTVVLVEHEPHLMRLADRIIEIGPKAGEEGGRVIFDGTPKAILQSTSPTAKYLDLAKTSVQRDVRTVGDEWLELLGATGRNLKNVDLRIPLRTFTVVMGRSGAGKSSLVLDTLCPALSRAFGEEAAPPLAYRELVGINSLSGCLSIDQSPIQRSNRSCPATYSKAMEDIRGLFADTPDAKGKKLTASHFSFNSDSGRCVTCEGLGYTTVDMQFMADVQLPCSDCNGKRFQREILEVRYRDLNISEVLDLSVSKAQAFFRGYGQIQERLQPLIELGLGYLPLGQSLSTVSAGESMRLKLAAHLASNDKVQSKGKLIVMDEPTTGLHFSDVDRLVDCVQRLVDAGNTVVVIEHNQQLLSRADYGIELGPGPGESGGQIIAQGTIESIRANIASKTGKYL